MAATPEAFIAANRFGFGAKENDLAMISGDHIGWLQAQLDPRYARNAEMEKLPKALETVLNFRDMQQQRKMDKQAAQNGDADALAKAKGVMKDLRDDYIREAAIRTRVAALSDAPFFERLVHFWSNHFTVSAIKKQDMPLVAAFERDAIRPNILGSFEGLLVASTRHPAMQIYLDNVRSIGPNSRAGESRGKGLNENLAREIMELHTLGVGSGYTQADVTEFAKMLTGWTVDVQQRGDGSGFFFARMVHEPGDKKLLGKTYPEDGEGEVLAALHTFAQSPATAKFISTKLARHFIADDPPASAVAQLTNAYQRSNGNLMYVYRVLLAMPEVWQNPLPKMKTPNDYIISLVRAADVDAADAQMIGAFRTLGQVPFTAASPAGWSDMGKDWISAEALLQRIDLARNIAKGIYTKTDPMQLLEHTIGPVASGDTKFAVARAGSAADALALLFASPEFQRR
ncbi:MAG: DUF1800 domain-containing protein [Micavibrio sp.]|nr:DUF1800 domain-containing protein [Micavibrio sp.]